MENGTSKKFMNKDLLDTVNSFSWFFMDASWMLQEKNMALFMTIPTILSGLLLCFIEKRKSLLFINIAIMSWILMNVSWMLSELLNQTAFLIVAKTLFTTGIILIFMAIAASDNISDTFSHFKRFRVKNFWR
jgi:hypothetical protein